MRIDELARPLFEGFPPPSLRFSVDTYRLRYRSTDFDGSAADIQAQLFVPRYVEPESRPVLVFGSGTTGIADACAPSREVPELRRWGHYRANMLAYASAGFITVFPDYLGFNDPDRPQRYFSHPAEAHVLLDAARAVQAFFAEYPQKVRPSGVVFAAGYSQGGHAAFAAADLRPTYAPEVRLCGIIGFAATTSVTALLKEGAYYAPDVLYSYAAMYGKEQIDPGEYLQERWARTLEADANSMCVDEFQNYYPFDGKKALPPGVLRGAARRPAGRGVPVPGGGPGRQPERHLRPRPAGPDRAGGRGRHRDHRHAEPLRGGAGARRQRGSLPGAEGHPAPLHPAGGIPASIEWMENLAARQAAAPPAPVSGSP